MNNFTEYELRSLLWAIKYVRERTTNCGDVMRSLMKRIDSMIKNKELETKEQQSQLAHRDNCKHERITSGDILSLPDRCLDCGENLG